MNLKEIILIIEMAASVSMKQTRSRKGIKPPKHIQTELSKQLKSVRANMNMFQQPSRNYDHYYHTISLDKEIAWQSREYTGRTCEKLFEYIQKYDPLSPMSIAAVWRIVHCKNCKSIYHNQIAESNIWAEYYIRFGGDLKIVSRRRSPKLLIRDLPSIKAVVAKGIKADPKMKPGAVKCSDDNNYLFEQLGDIAILAGMIDPDYVSEDPEDSLLQRLLHFKAYDSVPPLIASKHINVSCLASISDETDSRVDLRVVKIIPEHFSFTFIFNAVTTNVNLHVYLLCGKFDENSDSLIQLYEVFGKTEIYQEYVTKCAQLTIDRIKQKFPDKNIIYADDIFSYNSNDIYIEEQSDNNILLAPYSHFYKLNNFKAEMPLDRLRDKYLDRDWRDKDTMTGLQLREFFIERTKQYYLKELETWRFCQFVNCDFDKNLHPLTKLPP